jgi:hypothetical protein
MREGIVRSLTGSDNLGPDSTRWYFGPGDGTDQRDVRKRTGIVFFNSEAY